ncbi:MAG: hypothetical protein MZV70_21395 [Desulfobacterales bacterium]|nr:hypothetical protein [Desulfobacterales bacterium]
MKNAWTGLGCQAVVAQTAFSAVIAMGSAQTWSMEGQRVYSVLRLSRLSHFMEKMAEYGFPYGIKEDDQGKWLHRPRHKADNQK